MRGVAALLAVSLLVGCGSSEQAGLSADAAELVPPDAIALISFDTDLNSAEWQRVMDVWGPVALSTGNLDFERDVRPAVGDQLDFVVLDVEDGTPESFIALVQPKDESKLPALVDQLGPGYRLEEIGDWWIITDSEGALSRVREAHLGRSLADVEWFGDAKAELSGDAVITAYGNGRGLESLSDELGTLVRVMGSPQWVAAHLAAEDDAVRLHAQSASRGYAVYRPMYRPSLLREVPSGAILAVSFKNAGDLLKLADLPPLRGEGVLYVVPSPLVPTVVLTVESPGPQAAARALERLAAQIRDKTRGALAMHVVTRGNRVVLTNGLGPAPTTGGLLVDDPPFKDALAAADVPEEVAWLAYADIERLMPIVRAVSQLLGPAPQLKRLERMGTLVAFGAQSGLEARLTVR